MSDKKLEAIFERASLKQSVHAPHWIKDLEFELDQHILESLFSPNLKKLLDPAKD